MTAATKIYTPKDTEIPKAYGQLRSLNVSAANAIIALQMGAEELYAAGDDEAGAAFIQKSHDIAAAMTAIHRVRARLRSKKSLMGPISALDAITHDARTASAQMRKLARTLNGAARLIDALRRLADLVV
ncbi:hypothetical protein [Aestuariivita sp.]|jgi:hypothetical protein|uniref:hypothetical protein n=1 Tax=Aestuariivita sp. TaxID=1872407 RepID=UPI002171EAE0|nr:hypothetical protein [Aestuariivita sp.]MCE8005937.1 hypothetical protein [Aestuariivita sp.]